MRCLPIIERCDNCQHWAGEVAGAGRCARLSSPLVHFFHVLHEGRGLRDGLDVYTAPGFRCGAFLLEEAGLEDPPPVRRALLLKPREWPGVVHVPDAETAKELYGSSFGLPSRDDPPRPAQVLELVDHRLRKEPNQ